MKKTYEIKVSRIKESVGEYTADSPSSAVNYWKDRITKADWYDEEREMMLVLAVNTKYRIIGHALVSLGTLNESLCHPRDVFRPVIALGAYGLIMMHNHPSGVPDPSSADISATRRVKDGSSILGIHVLDHIIVGTAMDSDTPYYSFKEKGLL